MPPKRRTSLGRSTSASRRVAASRAAQAPEQVQTRREEDRARHTTARAAETTEHTNTRIGAQRTRQAASRAVEAPEQVQTRRGEDRARHADSRAAEAPEQVQTRRGEDRARHTASRAAKSPEQRRTRSEDQRRRQSTSRAAHWAFLEGEAFRYDPANNYDSHPQLHIGQMTHVCSNCHALKWLGEAPGMCCSGGKVRLPALRPPPEPLESLMSGTTSQSKHFLENIRKYNSCFQMTSFGATNQVSEPSFMATFKVQGQVHQLVGISVASLE
jgi:hypothetical protein